MSKNFYFSTSPPSVRNLARRIQNLGIDPVAHFDSVAVETVVADVGPSFAVAAAGTVAAGRETEYVAAVLAAAER